MWRKNQVVEDTEDIAAGYAVLAELGVELAAGDAPELMGVLLEEDLVELAAEVPLEVLLRGLGPAKA